MGYRDVENRVFQENLHQWLQSNPSEWVVLEGDIVIGFFPDHEAAYNGGVTTLLSRDFFMKQILSKYVQPRRPTLGPAHA